MGAVSPAGPQEALEYLDTRAAQGFTAIQAVALAELDGLTDPNAYGKLPLIDKDPTRPCSRLLGPCGLHRRRGQPRGLYVGLLPPGDAGSTTRGATTRASSRRPTRSLRRVSRKAIRRKGVIWILGGDRTADGVENTGAPWPGASRSASRGKEDYDAVLMSFHPRGGETSSTWFHDDAVARLQHAADGPRAGRSRCRAGRRSPKDYARTPVKPVIDGEPLYEDHPLAFRASHNGYSFDAHIRQRAYWDVFSGAAGHTYGNHSVWQMYAPGRKPVNGPLMYWNEAIHRPGANADAVRAGADRVAPVPFARAGPVAGRDTPRRRGPHRATRGDGYAFVYSPQGRKFTVVMDKLPASQIKAWWFNPRNGAVPDAGEFDPRGAHEFACPSEGFGSDWVLGLDDAARGFPMPQATSRTSAPRPSPTGRTPQQNAPAH